MRPDFLTRLRRANIQRCEQNFKHAISSWNVMEWGCALAGEGGELSEAILALVMTSSLGKLNNTLKKVKREQDGIAGSRIAGDQMKAVADELADVIIYADLLAEHCGIDLAKAISDKFNETSRKVGFQHDLEV